MAFGWPSVLRRSWDADGIWIKPYSKRWSELEIGVRPSPASISYKSAHKFLRAAVRSAAEMRALSSFRGDFLYRCMPPTAVRNRPRRPERLRCADFLKATSLTVDVVLRRTWSSHRYVQI
eukprot:3696353-Prymnesium_polylepis.1